MVTVGMFDGFHLGHRQLVQHLLSEATSAGLAPVVLTFDRHPRSVVDTAYVPQLLSTTDERMALLKESGVPQVVLVQFTPELAALSACSFARMLCSRLAMRRLLLGYDNQFGSRANNDFDQLPALASQMDFAISHDTAVLLQGVEVSSTKIRQALTCGDVRLANTMLAAPYCLTGTVVHGRHVGSSMGFPTANVQLADNKLVPGAGVYAAVAIVGTQRYRAMVNLGPQPTFGQRQSVLEVHLLDFRGDLYGRLLRVEFVDRLRDIFPFSSPDALKVQLQQDKELLAEMDLI